MAHHHNAQNIPIDELPSELLVHIFHLVKDASLKEVLNHRLNETKDLGWIKLSHVCRKWRELAINAPTLWNDIDVTRPNLASEMLRRSQTAPLHLHSRFNVVPPQRDYEPILRAAERQMSRVRELDLPDVDSKLLELFTHNVDTPAPILESIRIRSAQAFPACSLTRLLRRKMPSLRVLNIDNFIIPHPLPSFPNLVSLTVRGPYKGSQHLLTVLETLESLEAMPRIEHVELVEVVAPFAVGDTTSLRLSQRKTIDLPKLQSFAIEGAHLDSIFVINALRYPSNAAIDIACYVSCFTEARTQATVDICSRLRGCETPIDHTYIYVASTMVLMKCGPSVYSDKAPLRFELYEVSSPTDVLIRRFCQALPSHAVKKLSLDLSTASFEWWMEFAALWTGVAALSVYISGSGSVVVQQFFEGLRRDATLPELRALTIWGWNLQPHVAMLIDLLRHRKASGPPISRLCLSHNSKSELDTATLEQLGELTTVIFRASQDLLESQ